MRLPLAWAATVLLALRIGMYLGGVPTEQRAERAAESAGDLATRPAVRETLPVKGYAPSPAQRRPQAQRPAAPPAPAAAERHEAEAAKGVVSRALEGPEDTLAALSFRRQRSADSLERLAAPAAPPPTAGALYIADGANAVTGPVLTRDSARALLGADPLVVPGLPVRRIYQARRMGYSALVVVEQALDSSTTITVISGRPGTLQLDAAVVTSAARADTTKAAERALAVRGRAAQPTDSLALAERRANAVSAYAAVADRPGAELFLEVRGPLSADSLAALKRRLQPLRP